MGVLDFDLTQDQLQDLSELSDFKPGFPWSFLNDEDVLELIHGKNYQKLDIHR
jgi:hypothetical protein